ncbi:MAG: glycosyltransferase family 92 protein [Chlamydiia bacterium]
MQVHQLSSFTTRFWLGRAGLCAVGLWFGVSASAQPLPTVGIATMFKNETPYMVEWIEYHRLLGVSAFWLYDNESTDSPEAVLAPYIEQGLVHLIRYPTVEKTLKFPLITQVLSFRDGVTAARGKVDWLAFIDMDEFFLPQRDRSLPQCLARFEPFGGVFVNWRCFGTSGVTLPQGGWLLGALTACSLKGHPNNFTGKVLVRPDKVVVPAINNVHWAPLLQSELYAKGDGTSVSQEESSQSLMPVLQGDKLLVLNHYVMRDENFFWNYRIPLYSGGAAICQNHYRQYASVPNDAMIRFLKKNYPEAWNLHWAPFVPNTPPLLFGAD